MLYFLEKTGKIAAALGAPSQTPIGLRRLGDPPPGPRVVTHITYYSYTFEEGVCYTNVIAVKKNIKNLKIAIMFCFCRSFLTSNSA